MCSEGASLAAVDASGQPLTDANNQPIIGTDLSDSGLDPGSSNAEDANDTGSTEDVTLFDPPALPLGEISGSVFTDTNNDAISTKRVSRALKLL
jgi:hypothetical protein